MQSVLCDFTYSDYTSPYAVSTAFNHDPSLKLRRTSENLFVYNEKTGMKEWERDFDDNIAQVLRPVQTGSSTILHKFDEFLFSFYR